MKVIFIYNSQQFTYLAIKMAMNGGYWCVRNENCSMPSVKIGEGGGQEKWWDPGILRVAKSGENSFFFVVVVVQ